MFHQFHLFVEKLIQMRRMAKESLLHRTPFWWKQIEISHGRDLISAVGNTSQDNLLAFVDFFFFLTSGALFNLIIWNAKNCMSSCSSLPSWSWLLSFSPHSVSLEYCSSRYYATKWYRYHKNGGYPIPIMLCAWTRPSFFSLLLCAQGRVRQTRSFEVWSESSTPH